MEEYVKQLKTQLDNQNRLTKTLLTAVFDELDKKIEELKQLLNKKDDMDTIKSTFQELWGYGEEQLDRSRTNL